MSAVGTSNYSTPYIEIHFTIKIIHLITVVTMSCALVINSAASKIKSSVLLFIIVVASDSGNEIVLPTTKLNLWIPAINIATTVAIRMRAAMVLTVPTIYSIFLLVAMFTPHSIHSISIGACEAMILVVWVAIPCTYLHYTQSQQDNSQQQQPIYMTNT